MEKIALFETFNISKKNKQVNEKDYNNIMDLLNELSELDPKCLSEDDYEKLIKYLPLSPTHNNQVLAAACNVIASLCSVDLARHHFGEKITVSTVNILKSLASCINKDKCIQECLLQTCRAVGNLCYYHEENTKCALKEGCLLITMELLKTINNENIQPVIIGLLLNLTHLDDYNYKFQDNTIEELNFYGIQYMEYKNNNYRFYINLVSVMINIVRKSSSNTKITDYEKCYFIDRLLETHNMHANVTSICIKFIKQVSKTYNVYNWILKEKHKTLIEVLDKYEENQEEDPKLIVKKICDIIILLSNDDGSMEKNKHLNVLYLVEWLLKKLNSKNLYVKLSAVRSLGNFSRFKYEPIHTTISPANIIMKHITWFINNLDKSIKDKNSLMEVSILCLFKNLLYVTNFESVYENDIDKLIKTTIDVLNHTTFNPIVMKGLDVIRYIIKKGGISQKQLVLYKNSTFIKLVTTHCNSDDEDIKTLAKKLLFSINEDIYESEIVGSKSAEDNNIHIKDKI
uniref:Rap1 GTPase-GDP dissociation stimulator 1-B n=1 Tax=Schizaphis graminum TaxID=13262 RepID=A0A2S2NU52_SCHGA